MSKITYDDKIDLHVDSSIANINKVSASDMNEIKTAVNDNADDIGDISTLTTTDKTSVVNAVNELNAPEKWVAVGTTTPTDGRRVWFSKGKNLLPNISTTQTISGVTFTLNSDKTITVNGTANADISFNTTPYLSFDSGTYILSGCPSGGASTTYSMVLEGTARDTGSGKTFSVANNKRVLIEIKSGTSCNNLLFKPMIEVGSTITTYEPYIEPSINVDNETIYQRPVILWQNSTPTSSFANQTIQLYDTTDNYSYWEVIYLRVNNATNGYSSGRLPMYCMSTRISFPSTTLGFRDISIRSADHSQISCGSYNYYATYNSSTTTTNNAQGVPYMILGYK